MKTTLISGSDHNYYPLLREWLHSVRRFQESANLAICIIDSGLTPEQRAELEPRVTKIVRPDWPNPQIKRKARGLEHLKACVCRPFIPVLFPGYQTYLWMDSDTWVQDWAGVEMFIKAAQSRPDAIAITNGADRAYGSGRRIQWLWHLPVRIRNFYFSNARKPFGARSARALLSCPVLSAACFALDGNAPHWQRWQELAIHAALKGKVFTAEQTALGYLIYLEDFQAELLPAYALWQCSTPPVRDLQDSVFTEPYTPHKKIGILHLSGIDPMRANRNATLEIQTRQGGTTAMNLRYPHYDGGRLETGAPQRR